MLEKMAVDASERRCTVLVLLFSTCMLVYFYWHASSSSTALFVEVEELTQKWSNANRTADTLQNQLRNCKEQVRIKLVYGHFGTKTLRHHDTSAPVPKCPSECRSVPYIYI